MPKKLKLDLKGLKVQSFVTSLDKGEESKIKGGSVVNTVCPVSTCPGACEPPGTPTCDTICGTCETCETCVTCATCPTCYWKVNTCAPDCTDGC